MKFIVNSSELLKELQKLSGVLSSGNTLPILDNFLFEFEEGMMKIVAFRFRNNNVYKLKCRHNRQWKDYTAKLLLDTLKTFSSQPSYIFNQR